MDLHNRLPVLSRPWLRNGEESILLESWAEMD